MVVIPREIPLVVRIGIGGAARIDIGVIGHVRQVGANVVGRVRDDGCLAVVGVSRTAYLLTLLSHIILAAIVVPFVLLAFYYALSGKFDRHRRIVKFTLPIWLYVSISGVIVYLMISQYY